MELKRRDEHLLIAVIGLAAGMTVAAPPRLTAQTKPKRAAPAVTSDMIVMPIELVAGKPATLAVLDENGKIVSGVAVGLSDGEQLKTDESGRAHFLAPLEAGVLFARIPDTETRAVGDVARREGADYLHLTDAPRVASLKDRITIRGAAIEGDADRNRVELGGKTVFVLAASPVELIVPAPPNAESGTTKLTVKVRGQEAATQIILVNLIFPTFGEPMRPGKKRKLTFEARGTNQPLELEARNLSPAVIRFKHGEQELVRTRGGKENSASIQVKGLRAGEFSIAVELAPHPGMANVEAARDFLAAAQKDAPANQKQRIGKILRKLKKNTPNVPAARKEFEWLTSGNSHGDYEALIRATREALFGEE